jgi:hypothetical protein
MVPGQLSSKTVRQLGSERNFLKTNNRDLPSIGINKYLRTAQRFQVISKQSYAKFTLFGKKFEKFRPKYPLCKLESKWL